jgi:hypothetical protein
MKVLAIETERTYPMTAVSAELDTAQISAAVAARRRGLDFLLEHIGPDGEIVDAGRPRVTYYRFPWALAVGGETETAFRVLDWIERTALGPDGQVHGGVAWDAAANKTTNTYPETIVAYGAVLLRRLDIARATMRFASQFHDAATGGIFTTREATGPHDTQLLFPTAQFGMSALMIGDQERALQTGAWFKRLWEAQPELPHRLYTIWTPAGGLATTVPEGEDARHYINDAREERQLHYNGGIAASFLTQLFMATGDGDWLELARAFQRFSMDSTPNQFKTKQVCKSAWGAGLLYLATRDERYLPWLQTMAEWFVTGQEADGGWRNTSHLDPDPPLAHRLEITAEFVVHLDTVIAALSAAAARGSA